MSSELRKYGSTSVVQTSNIGFTSEVSNYLVVHTGPGEGILPLELTWATIPLKLFGMRVETEV